MTASVVITIAIHVFWSGFSFKKKRLIIAESIGAKATITNVFATFVFSIETTNTILVIANEKIKAKPCQPFSKIFFNKFDLWIIKRPIKIITNGQGLYDFTKTTISWINDQKIKNGILNINILHTSASLIIQENADPDVQTDLINYFNKIAPMDNKLYIHTTEGKDDMPAHIKSSLTNNQISLSVENGELLLGTWQGIYLFEHRLNPQTRTIIHHFLGEV